MKIFATRRLQLESLENRELMAGNVSVAFHNGDLYITGDGAANDVQVRQSSPGVYKITGQTHYNAATKINGNANGTSTATGVYGNVFVSLGGGDDHLDFGTGDARLITVPKNLSIDMGAGNDWANVRDVKTGGNLAVHTGTGKDNTHIYKAEVGGSLFVEDPSSVNSGDYDKASVNSCKVKGQIQFIFRGGNDSAEITSSTADRVYADLGNGNDSFQMTFTKPRGFTVLGGGGSDFFFVPDVNGTRYSGSGFETVRR